MRLPERVNAAVIHMDRSRDRMEHFTAVIKRVHFVDQTITVEAVDAAVSNIPVREAICISHAKALMLARRLGWNEVLVLEDDVDFPLDCNEVWDNARQFDVSASVVYLGISGFDGNDSGSHDVIAPLESSDGAAPGHPPFVKIINLGNNHVTGNFAVLYRRDVYDAAIRILMKNAHIDLHADILLSRILRKHIVIMAPFAASTMPLGASSQRSGDEAIYDVWERINVAHRSAMLARVGLVALSLGRIRTKEHGRGLDLALGLTHLVDPRAIE